MKIYAYLAALFAVIGVLYGAYHAGQVSEQHKQDAAVIAFKNREADLILQVETGKAQIELVTNARISVVDKAVGDCLDSRLPAVLLDSLQHDVPGN